MGAMSIGSAHRDRKLRLRVFGLLVILSGMAVLALGLLYLAAPSMQQVLPELEIAPAQALAGGLTFGVIGAFLIACGVGSMRYRRWARPAMLMVGWTWLLVGLAALAFVLSNLDDLVILAGASRASLPPEAERIVRWALLLPSVALGLLVPLAVLWAYAPRDILRTCRERHPEPDWSDRCPSTVLVLALALGLAGVLLAPMALRPAVPWFGRLLTGTAGSFVTIALGVVFAWTGWALFRLKTAGLWTTGIVAGVLGISTVWTLLETPRVEWYRAVDYPEKYIEQMLASGEPSAWPEIAVTSVLTVLTVVYLASIRKHFAGAPSDGG